MPTTTLLRQGVHQLLRLRVDPSKSLEMNWFQALSLASESLNVRFGGIWLFDPTRRRLRSRIIYDRMTDLFRPNLTLEREEHPLYFDTLATEKVIAAKDIAQDPRTQTLASYAESLGITALLDVPLFRNGLMIGVVCFESDVSPRVWTEDQVGFAQAMSETFVRMLEAYERAHMLASLSTSNAELQAIIDSTEDWLLTLDQDRRVSVVNQPFLAFWESLSVATKVGDLLSPELCPVSSVAVATFQQAWAGERVRREVVPYGGAHQGRKLQVTLTPVITHLGVERVLVHVRPAP